MTTGDLRRLIAKNSEIDFNDENKSYVALNEVVDDEGKNGVRFTVIFTTPSLAARMSPPPSALQYNGAIIWQKSVITTTEGTIMKLCFCVDHWGDLSLHGFHFSLTF